MDIYFNVCVCVFRPKRDQRTGFFLLWKYFINCKIFINTKETTSYINAPFSMAYLFVSSKQLLIEIITDNRAAFFLLPLLPNNPRTPSIQYFLLIINYFFKTR